VVERAGDVCEAARAGLGEGVGVAEALAAGDPTGEAGGDGVAAAASDAGVTVGLATAAPAAGVTVGVGVAAPGVGLAVGLPVGLGVGETVALGAGLGVGETVGLGVGVGVGVGQGGTISAQACNSVATPPISSRSCLHF
jgi:hypothetical protein